MLMGGDDSTLNIKNNEEKQEESVLQKLTQNQKKNGSAIAKSGAMPHQNDPAYGGASLSGKKERDDLTRHGIRKE